MEDMLEGKENNQKRKQDEIQYWVQQNQNLKEEIVKLELRNEQL